MGYIDDSLAANEQLVYRAHFPWLYRAGAWCVLLASLAAAIFLRQTGEAPGWLVPGLVFVAGLVVFLAVMVPIWAQQIGVTTQRLIYRRGLIARSTQELQLNSLEEVRLEQGIFGRLLGFGRLTVAGTGIEDIHLPTLGSPIVLRRMIQEAVSLNGARWQSAGSMALEA